MGIKESLEVLDGVLALVTFIERSLDDGKIDLRDLVKLLPVVGKIKDAFVGGQLVVGEIADADAAEWQALAGKAIEVIQRVADLVTRFPA